MKMHRLDADRPKQADAAPGDGFAPRSLDRELIDLGALLGTIWRRRWFVALGAVAVAALAVLIASRIPPTYKAESRVLLEGREGQVIDIANVVSDRLLGMPVILSEIALIQSNEILAPVARKLELARFPEFNPSLETRSPLAAAIATLRPRPQAEPASQDAVAAAILIGKVRVSQLGESYTLRIEASTTNPQLSADIANAVAQAYLDYNVSQKTVAAGAATAWLDDRATALRLRLDEAEAAVEKARVAHLSATGVSPTVIQRQIDDMSSRLVDARVAFAAAAARRRSFSGLVAEGNIGAAIQVAETPQFQRLVERRQNIEQQRLALQRRGVEADAELLQLDLALRGTDEAIALEAAEIDRGLAATADIAEQSLKGQEAQLAVLERALTDQSELTLAFRAAEREAEAIRNTYLTFLNRLTSARERGDFQDPNARIVGVAGAPSQPVAPNKPAFALLGFVLGGGAAAVAALALEARTGALRSTATATALTGAPALATLPPTGLRPRDGAAAVRAALASPPEPLLQRFRRADALLDGHGRQRQRMVLVASVDAAEDAISVAALLARSAATTSGRAALVLGEKDINLWREALSGDGAVTPVVFDPVNDGAEKLAGLRGGYDCVVVAVGALQQNSDGLIAGREADVAVLVVRLGRTTEAMLVEAAGELARFNVPLGGIVAIDPAAPRITGGRGGRTST